MIYNYELNRHTLGTLSKYTQGLKLCRRNVLSESMKNDLYQLGELEELALMIVAILQGEAYGVKVMDEIKEQTKRKVNISAVHTVLDRLEKKGFVTSKMGEPSAERGGRRKRLFQITSEGAQAIQYVHRVRNELFAQIPAHTLSALQSS